MHSWPIIYSRSFELLDFSPIRILTRIHICNGKPRMIYWQWLLQIALKYVEALYIWWSFRHRLLCNYQSRLYSEWNAKARWSSSFLRRKKRNFKEYLRERTKILDISIVDLQRKVDEISTKMFSANLKRQFARIEM